MRNPLLPYDGTQTTLYPITPALVRSCTPEQRWEWATTVWCKHNKLDGTVYISVPFVYAVDGERILIRGTAREEDRMRAELEKGIMG